MFWLNSQTCLRNSEKLFLPTVSLISSQGKPIAHLLAVILVLTFCWAFLLLLQSPIRESENSAKIDVSLHYMMSFQYPKLLVTSQVWLYLSSRGIGVKRPKGVRPLGLRSQLSIQFILVQMSGRTLMTGSGDLVGMVNFVMNGCCIML